MKRIRLFAEKSLKRFMLALLALFELSLTGCGAEETVYHSDTSAEDCYLCKEGIENLLPLYWGQKNVAIISLNTFEPIVLEINRYDRLTGQMLEEPTGTVSLGGGRSKDDGFFASLLLDYDLGYAMGTVDLYEDEILDPDKAAEFLCEDCLNELLPQRIDQCFGVGAIELSTKEICVFDERNSHFTVGDFEIDCEIRKPDKKTRQLDLFIYYPMRFEFSYFFNLA
ncbi:hypothetical protein [uncultured Oscillibacter sp.]|uniref:hypothetical protein n=1 Tax=uncultured Oscillibacter sp. TaxID=876091 RepID=UPI00260D9D97|nr:hypothetical protein [uncultured Oscillibacter sp.]